MSTNRMWLLKSCSSSIQWWLRLTVAAFLLSTWVVVGLVTGFPSWWQVILYSVTASVTFVMVFVIQHTQGRQIAATQRKLDELIRTTTRADDALIAVEEAPDEELQALTDLNLEDRERAGRDTADSGVAGVAPRVH